MKFPLVVVVCIPVFFLNREARTLALRASAGKNAKKTFKSSRSSRLISLSEQTPQFVKHYHQLRLLKND